MLSRHLHPVVRHSVRAALRWILSSAGVGRPVPGHVRFGSLRRLEPISHDFGFDRGLPIDRYYIHRFLELHSSDIQGRVVEVGDDTYTRTYGQQRVKTIDILHVDGDNPRATIVADLSDAAHIPSNSFDCIILTQTLHLIYDVAGAIRTLHRILTPNGVLLATFPGISQIARDRWGDEWYWAFTAQSARRMFEEVFGAQAVQVEAHGNVLAAISFLHGLAAEELTQSELDTFDRTYPVLIALRAVRTGTVDSEEPCIAP